MPHYPQPDIQTPSSPKGIPIGLIIDCIENKNLTITETARFLGCNHSSVSERLSKIGYKPGYLKTWKENRGDILAWYQSEVLRHLTDAKLKKSSASQLAMVFGVLYDKERLERGQSTQNVAYADMVEARDRIDAELEKFRARFGVKAKAGRGDSSSGTLGAGDSEG